MTGNIRAYIVVLFLGTVALFILARVNRLEETQKYFRVWIVSWFVVTSAAFLAHNYWIYVLIVAVALSLASPRNAPMYQLVQPEAKTVFLAASTRALL